MADVISPSTSASSRLGACYWLYVLNKGVNMEDNPRAVYRIMGRGNVPISSLTNVELVSARGLVRGKLRFSRNPHLVNTYTLLEGELQRRLRR